MRRRKIKEAGLVMLGLGLIGLFVLVAESVSWKYHEYGDRAEEQQIKRLMKYRNLLNNNTMRHEFENPLDFREYGYDGEGTFTMPGDFH